MAGELRLDKVICHLNIDDPSLVDWDIIYTDTTTGIVQPANFPGASDDAMPDILTTIEASVAPLTFL